MDTPSVPVNFVPAHAGEVLHLGKIIIRIMEDGSNTHDRIGMAEFIVPPNIPGPTPHWHETSDHPQHDETFLVTKGTMRFHLLNGDVIDAKEGDYVVVPVRSPHTFSNPHDVEARFVCTFTPSYYINYFKLLSTMVAAGQPMTAEANRKAMAYFATIGVAEDEMKKPEERTK